MVQVAYYSPSIPAVESTARYAHASAFLDHAETCTLITEAEPPSGIEEGYDAVHVLDGGTVRSARRAARITTDIATGREPTLYVTTFHYAPVLSGTLADLPWVVDVFDDPMQYALNNPRSHHRIAARVLTRLIDRADGVVHDYHPHAGRVMGEDPRFAPEGCPVDLIEPAFTPPTDRLECVWAGSPRLDRGMAVLLETLERVDRPIHVSVFGDADEEVPALAERRGVADRVTFHGWTAHETVREAIADAHVGFGVLPDRPDWRHSSPLKVREYLAGGTIPVVSDFPGTRFTAESAAVYTEPTATGVTRTLDRLGEVGRTDPEAFAERMRKGRRKAEMRPLSWANDWYVRQCMSSGLGGDVELP